MKIWEFFAIFGVSPDLPLVMQQIVFWVGIIIAVISTLLGYVMLDKRLPYGNSAYEGVLNSFYGWFCVLPALFLSGSLELLFIMIMSFNMVAFWVALGIGILSLLIRFALFDGDKQKLSAYGLVKWIQKQACLYIMDKGYKYPCQIILGSIIATQQIRKTQQKYLSNGQQGSI